MELGSDLLKECWAKFAFLQLYLPICEAGKGLTSKEATTQIN